MSRKSLVGENLIVEVHYDLSCDGGEVGSHGCVRIKNVPKFKSVFISLLKKIENSVKNLRRPFPK